MKLSEKQKAVLEVIGNLQFEVFAKYGDNYEYIGFDHNGYYVIHPLLEETGRFEVDPIEYYGKHFKESKFVDLI